MPKAPTSEADREDELAADIEYDIRKALRSSDPVKGVVNAVEDVVNADIDGGIIAMSLSGLLLGDDVEEVRTVIKAVAVAGDVLDVDFLEDEYLCEVVSYLKDQSGDEDTAVTAYLLLHARDEDEPEERSQAEWEADYAAGAPGFGAQQEMTWE